MKVLTIGPTRSVFEELVALGTSTRGLTEDEAANRLHTHGENRVEAVPAVSWWQRARSAAGSPFVVLLAVLSVILVAVGDLRGAITCLTMVAVCAGVRWWQLIRADRAMAALHELDLHTATVRRRVSADAVPRRREVPVEDLVPGDVVELDAGDVVGADVRLLRTKRLRVDQSVLSGESLPVGKNADTAGGTVASALDRPDLCFAGTGVVSGSAVGVVVATGSSTAFAEAGSSITMTRPVSSIDAGVRSVSWTLVRFMAALVPIVLVISGGISGDWTRAMLFAISVAVGLTPELLPVVVAATFLRGAVALSHRNVVVKRPESLGDLGAVDVLCIDKTGTLTEDRVAYAFAVDLDGRPDDLVDTYAYLAAAYQSSPHNQLDTALTERLDDTDEMLTLARFTAIDDTPFDPEQRRSTVMVRERGDEYLLITKGDPQAVIELCDHTQTGGCVRPMTGTARRAAELLVANYHDDGVRILAVAAKTVPDQRFPAPSLDHDSGFTLVGFVGFVDPVRPSAEPAIHRWREAGLAITVVTGDSPAVARHVCRRAGMPVDRVVLGAEVDELTDRQLADLARASTLFARVDPHTKTRIVTALRGDGHTVGLVGDGVNDTAALRVADVGICMGTAAATARGAADLILLDNDLTAVADAVVQGRRTLANSAKFVTITTASNLGNAISVVAASVLLPFLPMLPVQLMVQNLLYETTQLTLPFDTVDRASLARPGRWRPRSLTAFAITFGLISSAFDLATFAMLWWILGADTPAESALFQTGWFVEATLSQVLVVLVLRSRPGRTTPAPTRLLLAAVGLASCAALILPFLPAIHWIGLTALPTAYFPWLAGILVSYLAITYAVLRFWPQAARR
ncbi:magnesium-translocating P-type ATPase [Nocardia sp. NPDC058519]|uniref:magnesium-translocating P-type ATPase n=1 Tax=Nocardia sp. NPDC058519 TaxID=3346535 RepID=UPI0036660095